MDRRAWSVWLTDASAQTPSTPWGHARHTEAGYDRCLSSLPIRNGTLSCQRLSPRAVSLWTLTCCPENMGDTVNCTRAHRTVSTTARSVTYVTSPWQCPLTPWEHRPCDHLWARAGSLLQEGRALLCLLAILPKERRGSNSQTSLKLTFSPFDVPVIIEVCGADSPLETLVSLQWVIADKHNMTPRDNIDIGLGAQLDNVCTQNIFVRFLSMMKFETEDVCPTSTLVSV